MSKPCYEEYANHAMRFFARHPALNLKGPGLKKSDILNWTACDNALRTFSESEQAVILNVFRSKCIMTDAVSAMASQLHVGEGFIWQILSRFSREFAKHRELI